MSEDLEKREYPEESKLKEVADLVMTLGRRFEKQYDKSHDLWSWLPSRRSAEKSHRDYASEFTPSLSDIMMEASMVFGILRHGPDRGDMRRYEVWFGCPCGECENQEADAEAMIKWIYASFAKGPGSEDGR